MFSPLFKGAEGAETNAASAAVKSRAHRALCVILSQILLVCFIRLRLKYEKYLLYNLVYMWEIVKKRAENVPNLWWGVLESCVRCVVFYFLSLARCMFLLMSLCKKQRETWGIKVHGESFL